MPQQTLIQRMIRMFGLHNHPTRPVRAACTSGCMSCANKRSGARQSAANKPASAPTTHTRVSAGSRGPSPTFAYPPGCRHPANEICASSTSHCLRVVATSRSTRKMRACGKCLRSDSSTRCVPDPAAVNRRCHNPDTAVESVMCHHNGGNVKYDPDYAPRDARRSGGN